jgi:hypothetical protein
VYLREQLSAKKRDLNTSTHFVAQYTNNSLLSARVDFHKRRLEQITEDIQNIEVKSAVVVKEIKSKKKMSTIKKPRGADTLNTRQFWPPCLSNHGAGNSHAVPMDFYKHMKEMKTVNGHLANPVYCLTYDQSGRFIITASDDR